MSCSVAADGATPSCACNNLHRRAHLVGLVQGGVGAHETLVETFVQVVDFQSRLVQSLRVVVAGAVLQFFTERGHGYEVACLQALARAQQMRRVFAGEEVAAIPDQGIADFVEIVARLSGSAPCRRSGRAGV